MLNENDNTLTTTELEEQIDTCFKIGTIYWRDFLMTPGGKELMSHLPTPLHFVRAFQLFQFGFAGRMLMVPDYGDSRLGRFLLRVQCRKLWIANLRSSHGETVLDGERYPATPPLVLKMAEKFFREGFVAADCECVCNAVDNAR